MFMLNYRRPSTLAEASTLFQSAADGSYLAGGHTLIPVLKARLAAPDLLIDLRSISDLQGVCVGPNSVVIGATTTHAQVAACPELRRAIPALAGLAGTIGDRQVRNVGTIGGSVVNNDPSADYPAAVLGLGATVRTDRRSIPADDFFVGLYETACEPGEIVTAIEFPIPQAAGYAKLRNQASRYAIAGVFVSRDRSGKVRIAVTGAGADGVFRIPDMENALGAQFDIDSIKNDVVAENQMMTEQSVPTSYRAHLVSVLCRAAISGVGRAQTLS
ncbi:FAD binding domain-containing protein [Aliihoeflea sp. PC F10.4]